MYSYMDGVQQKAFPVGGGKHFNHEGNGKAYLDNNRSKVKIAKGKQKDNVKVPRQPGKENWRSQKAGSLFED